MVSCGRDRTICTPARCVRVCFARSKGLSLTHTHAHTHTHTHTHTHRRRDRHGCTHTHRHTDTHRHTHTLELCLGTLPLVNKEAVRTQIGGSLVNNQPNCLLEVAFTSEIEAVWVVFASLVSQNRGFRFRRSGPTNKIKISPRMEPPPPNLPPPHTHIPYPPLYLVLR